VKVSSFSVSQRVSRQTWFLQRSTEFATAVFAKSPQPKSSESQDLLFSTYLKISCALHPQSHCLRHRHSVYNPSMVKRAKRHKSQASSKPPSLSHSLLKDSGVVRCGPSGHFRPDHCSAHLLLLAKSMVMSYWTTDVKHCHWPARTVILIDDAPLNDQYRRSR
jgi:hypothetical protein